MYAFNDVALWGGIESSEDYPYKKFVFECDFDEKKVVMKDSGAIVLPPWREDKLKAAVALYGPVSVGVYATENFFDYHTGVFDDHICRSEPAIDRCINHALLIVGYGTDPEQGDYWLVKNSWGESFGEKGYIRIKRGVDMCGIAVFGVITKTS